MILDGGFASTRYEDEMFDAGGTCLLEGILNDRFVHHGQHFFGHGLGGGQHPGAEPGNRKHGFANQKVSPHVL